jgi:predicted nucleic acid-binding protein
VAGVELEAVKVLFDTSVLVAAVIEAHPAHERALPWLARGRSGEVEVLVSAHSAAETYAVLSTLPLSPRIGPGLARQLVQKNVLTVARVVTLSARDYGAVIDELGDLGVAGGAVYDALIARAAAKANVDLLLTLNPKHFLRVWPAGAERIQAP